MGRKLNLNNPQTFNEKLQWLKLHDRRPEYTQMVDKYAAKEVVTAIIGKEYIIPTLGVWNNADEIDFSSLPNRFILKCTHNSGSIVICKDKSTFDIQNAKDILHKGLKWNYYGHFREWPYKDVPPRIIAEKYMEDNSNDDLPDYKIHCFNGVPKLILVCRDRFHSSGLTEDFFSTTWKHLPIKRPKHPNSEVELKCPPELDLMLHLAKKLSRGIPFIRTDFYIVNHHVYFGELTFFPATGCERFTPDEFDKVFGSWIQLPSLKNQD